MPKWLRADEKDEEEGSKKDLSSIEIKPEVIADAVKPHLEATKKEISDAVNKQLAPVVEFFETQRREKEAAARKAQKESEENDDTDWITDPKGAVQKELAPLHRQNAAVAALLMRKETLGEMDYYSSDPDFKRRVDELIDKQPLQLRAHPEIILGAYKNIHYDMQQEIKDGKVKSKLSASTSSNGAVGGHDGKSKSDNEVTISDEEKGYAKKMGISEADWVKSKRELEYV